MLWRVSPPRGQRAGLPVENVCMRCARGVDYSYNENIYLHGACDAARATAMCIGLRPFLRLIPLTNQLEFCLSSYRRSRHYRDASSVRRDNQRTHLPHRGNASGSGPLACVPGQCPGRPHCADALLRSHRRAGGPSPYRLAHSRPPNADDSGIVPTLGSSPGRYRRAGTATQSCGATLGRLVSRW